MKDFIPKPHGSVLIDRILKGEAKKEALKRSKELKALYLNRREICDLESIATGVFSPLQGFNCKEDYESILEHCRLKTGTVWTIPITLSLEEEEVKDLGKEVLLKEKDKVLGLLEVEEVFKYDKRKEAKLIYKTEDPKHPGVAYLYSQGDYLVGGKVSLFYEPKDRRFKKYWLKPEITRRIFKEREWKTIVGFQTRNPIHRAHEFLIKTALQIVDGVFINPLVGETKADDIPPEVRLKCYKVLIDKYFPKERVLLGVYGAAMRYAGPREAVLHAIVRKNFGCTHFIVGRDHAGVGSYYAPDEARKFFREFDEKEIGINLFFFENAFFCRKCGEMATIKTCPHHENYHLSLSGSELRGLLKKGKYPEPELTRKEVAKILVDWKRREN